MGKPVQPPCPWFPHTRGAALARGPAAWGAAVSTSTPPCKKHLLPGTRAAPGHGRMTEDLAVALETESLAVIRPRSKWRPGRERVAKLAWEVRRPGSRAFCLWAPRCQGGALVPRPKFQEQHGFLMWGFPSGSLATCPSKAFEDTENNKTQHILPCQLRKRCLLHSGLCRAEGRARGPGSANERFAFPPPSAGRSSGSGEERGRMLETSWLLSEKYSEERKIRTSPRCQALCPTCWQPSMEVTNPFGKSEGLASPGSASRLGDIRCGRAEPLFTGWTSVGSPRGPVPFQWEPNPAP